MSLFGPKFVLREEEESPEDFRLSAGAAPVPPAFPASPLPAASVGEPLSKGSPAPALSAAQVQHGISKLLEERSQILADSKLSPKEKMALLENNRVTLLTLRGGRTTRSDEVVKWVLLFAAFTTIVLSILNVAAGLSTEVTLSFVGTVLGGTIATIVQKLGRV